MNFLSLSDFLAWVGQGAILPSLARVRQDVILPYPARGHRVRLLKLWSFFKRKLELYFKIQQMNFRKLPVLADSTGF
jgi:hypothetical protein